MMMVMMIYDGDETEDGEFEEAFCLRSGVWCLGVHMLTFFLLETKRVLKSGLLFSSHGDFAEGLFIGRLSSTAFRF